MFVVFFMISLDFGGGFFYFFGEIYLYHLYNPSYSFNVLCVVCVLFVQIKKTELPEMMNTVQSSQYALKSCLLIAIFGVSEESTSITILWP